MGRWIQLGRDIMVDSTVIFRVLVEQNQTSPPIFFLSNDGHILAVRRPADNENPGFISVINRS